MPLKGDCWFLLALVENFPEAFHLYFIFILFDPAVPEICYFNHDVEVFLIMIFIGNPDADKIGDAILVIS